MLTDSISEEEEEEVTAVKTPSLDAKDESKQPGPFKWAPLGHSKYVDLSPKTIVSLPPLTAPRPNFTAFFDSAWNLLFDPDEKLQDVDTTWKSY